MTHHQQDESDTHRLASEVKRMLDETIMRLRQDVRATDQLKAQAAIRDTAKVLNGLVTAYDHFKAGAEEAWNSSAVSGPAIAPLQDLNRLFR